MIVRLIDSTCFDFWVKNGHADPSKLVGFAYFGSEEAVADCTEKIVFVGDVSIRDVPEMYRNFLVVFVEVAAFVAVREWVRGPVGGVDKCAANWEVSNVCRLFIVVGLSCEVQFKQEHAVLFKFKESGGSALSTGFVFNGGTCKLKS